MKVVNFLIICLLLSIGYWAKAQVPPLSHQSKISLLTVGPGQDLYSIFGHTGIRVKDDSTGMDVVFNYGTFEFSDDFYFLFCMGKLNYKLATEPFQYFKEAYEWENRWVKEQILNLNLDQKQRLFDALMVNYQPENKYYLYDFYYDNCSTRPRLIIDNTLKDVLTIHFQEQTPDSSFRDMIDVYLTQQSWGDIGIDLALGLPSDVIADAKLKTFLPDYLFRSFALSTIQVEGEEQPLVKKVKDIVIAHEQPSSFDFSQPYMVFIYLLLLYLISAFLLPFPFAVVGIKSLDSLIFSFTGIAGWIILFLWFITDHNTTQNNLNILWSLPFLFPLGLLVWKSKIPKWLQLTFKVLFYSSTLLLVLWAFLPQKMNPFYFLWVLLLMQRYSTYAGIWKNTKLSRFYLFSLQKH